MADDQLLYQSPRLIAARWRCPPSDPLWTRENVIGGTILVFPSVPVVIHQSGDEPVIADRARVMFYNVGRSYRRELLDNHGDEALYLAPAPDLLREAIRLHDPRVEDRPDRPFVFTSGPASDAAFLWSRRAWRALEAGRADPLWLEEGAIHVLDELVNASYRARGAARRRPGRADRAHRDAVNDAKALLSDGLGEDWTIARIADAVGLSPFHLCRIFRARAGITIAGYLKLLRLRAAVDALREPIDLASLALRLGFASHSHFTDSFRGCFGVPPSVVRRELGAA